MSFPTTFVSVDIETTGLFPNHGDKIIQLSAVKFEDDELIDKWNSLINPRDVHNYASFVNGIDDDWLVDQPTIDEVIPSFKKFVGDLPWVGHNISFDFRFLDNEGLDITKYKENHYDTLTMARRVFGPSKNKLWRLERRFDIKNKHQHLSLDDAIATAKVYQRLRELVPEPRKLKRHSQYKKHIVADPQDHVLQDTTIVFTGHFDLDKRENLRHLVEQHGGKSPNIVSRQTDYLVLGTQTSKTKNPNHSSKELKAMEYGTPIISINDFLSMLGGK